MTRRGIRPCLAAWLGTLLVTGVAGLGCPASEDTTDRPVVPAPESTKDVGSESGPSVSPAPSSRILSLSPLATRFLRELGAGDRIVAVDGSAEPPALPGEESAPDGPPKRLEDLLPLDPDYVFLPALPDDQGELVPLASAGVRIVEFAPHSLEDVMALLYGVGAELVGEDGAAAFERRLLRPVALIAGQSSPIDRLRVLALVGVDPPEIAGGHSFETDLIEIAGASSLTHGGSDVRQPIDREQLAQWKPDLVVVMTDGELRPADQDRALELVGQAAPVVFFPYARETFWLEEPAREAARLRESIVALEHERKAAGKP